MFEPFENRLLLPRCYYGYDLREIQACTKHNTIYILRLHSTHDGGSQ